MSESVVLPAGRTKRLHDTIDGPAVGPMISPCKRPISQTLHGCLLPANK